MLSIPSSESNIRIAQQTFGPVSEREIKLKRDLIRQATFESPLRLLNSLNLQFTEWKPSIESNPSQEDEETIWNEYLKTASFFERARFKVVSMLSL